MGKHHLHKLPPNQELNLWVYPTSTKKITRHRVIASQMIGRFLTQGRVIFLIFLGANTLSSCSWLIDRPLKQLIYVGHPDDQTVYFICCIREMLGALFKLR